MWKCVSVCTSEHYAPSWYQEEIPQYNASNGIFCTGGHVDRWWWKYHMTIIQNIPLEAMHTGYLCWYQSITPWSEVQTLIHFQMKAHDIQCFLWTFRLGHSTNLRTTYEVLAPNTHPFWLRNGWMYNPLLLISVRCPIPWFIHACLNSESYCFNLLSIWFRPLYVISTLSMWQKVLLCFSIKQL